MRMCPFLMVCDVSIAVFNALGCNGEPVRCSVALCKKQYEKPGGVAAMRQEDYHKFEAVWTV